MADRESHKIEQYKAYLQDLGNIGARHVTARGFYLSVLSGLLAFLAIAGHDGSLKDISRPLFVIVGTAGIAICVLWLIHTRAFRALYKAKFKRIVAMEEELPFQNFKAEYQTMKEDRNYSPLILVECAISIVFTVLFAATIVLNLLA